MAIARALVSDAPIILADEPTGNLDSTLGREVMGLLRGVSDQGKTVLIVTHDTRYVDLADRVLDMQDGRVQELVR